MHDNINKRTDEYGGSVDNRCRFTLDVIKAVTSRIGGSRVGIRLTPFNYWHGTRDSDPMSHWKRLCEMIVELPWENRPAYVHMIEPRYDEILSESDKIKTLATEADSNKEETRYTLAPFRNILRSGGIRFLSAGNYNRDNALPAIEKDTTDCVIFGRHFIANPDLPRRLAEGLPFNKWDRSTFYGASPINKGYTDYPFWSKDLSPDALDI